MKRGGGWSIRRCTLQQLKKYVVVILNRQAAHCTPDDKRDDVVENLPLFVGRQIARSDTKGQGVRRRGIPIGHTLAKSRNWIAAGAPNKLIVLVCVLRQHL